jgi:polyhydroxybutyrate depolymerase
MVRRSSPILLVALLLVAACSDGDSTAAGDTTTATSPTGCAGGEPVSPGTERLEVPYDGVTRAVERDIPPGYDGTTPHPLLLDLHGFSSNIEQQDLFSGLPEAAASRGYLVLTPQAEAATLAVGDQEMTAPFWNLRPDESGDIVGAQDDIGFLRELIASTIADLCVDRARVYVTGNSMGAGMSAALACAMPDQIAAIAPVSGINLAAGCADLAPVSVIAFHGDTDPLVGYDGTSAPGLGDDNPSVEDRVGEFAAVASCAPAPGTTSPFADIDRHRWTGCSPGFDVELYTVVGGGHTWPGMLNYVDAGQLAEIGSSQELVQLADLDLTEIAGHMTVNLEATTVMLDFFDAHPTPGGAD